MTDKNIVKVVDCEDVRSRTIYFDLDKFRNEDIGDYLVGFEEWVEQFVDYKDILGVSISIEHIGIMKHISKTKNLSVVTFQLTQVGGK